MLAEVAKNLTFLGGFLMDEDCPISWENVKRPEFHPHNFGKMSEDNISA